ncbi:olfactory receptor 51B2-like protein [Clarias magur]|uniref:Olfactory receptor 51B2-like protein n=1 Tax=Clarias magur TaxID=1594786 RepID=A0A8J4WRG9_CLAMG|nr:olfactory receptor 51B2-like protein [Clarias magur]
MDLVHPVYISPLNTYPVLIGKDLLNRLVPLIDFKQLKIWTQVHEPLPHQAVGSGESQCQTTDTATESWANDQTSTQSSEPDVCSVAQTPSSVHYRCTTHTLVPVESRPKSMFKVYLYPTSKLGHQSETLLGLETETPQFDTRPMTQSPVPQPRVKHHGYVQNHLCSGYGME